MKKLLSICLVLSVLAGLLPGCGRSIRTFLGKPTKVAVIAQQRNDEAGLSLEAGAKRAAAELELELVNLSPEVQDSALQAEGVRQAVAEDCEAIVVAYRQSAEVTQALREAAEAGVALVYVDTAPGSVSRTIYATDHRAAGRKAAELMLEMLEVRRVRKGILGIIGVNQLDAAALQRESGFREAMLEHEYAIMDTRYDAKNPARASNIAEDYIREGEVDAIFALSEVSAVAAGAVSRDLGAGIIVVGVGQSQDLQDLLTEGHVRASLVQNYDAMGYDAVKAAAAIVAGEAPAEKLTDTGVKVLQSEAPLLRAVDLQLAVITPDRREPYWKELDEGAQKAARELGCTVANLSPFIQNEKEQVRQIRQAVVSGFYGIISASDSSEEVEAALQEAREAGMVVICVDRTTHEDADAAVEIDYREAGRLAAKTLLTELEAKNKMKGEVGIVSGSKDDPEDGLWEEGFREVFDGTDYKLLDTQYCENDAAQAHSMTTKMIGFGADAVFACGEGACVGAAFAVSETKRKVVVVGYGRSDALSGLLEDDMVQALLVPHPDTTGYDAVKAACAMILETEQKTDTDDIGVAVLRKE